MPNRLLYVLTGVGNRLQHPGADQGASRPCRSCQRSSSMPDEPGSSSFSTLVTMPDDAVPLICHCQASKDRSVRLWNIETTICVAVFSGEAGHMNEVLWHAPGGEHRLTKFPRFCLPISVLTVSELSLVAWTTL